MLVVGVNYSPKGGCYKLLFPDTEVYLTLVLGFFLNLTLGALDPEIK